MMGLRTRLEITLILSHAKTAKGYMLEDVKVISKRVLNLDI